MLIYSHCLDMSSIEYPDQDSILSQSFSRSSSVKQVPTVVLAQKIYLKDIAKALKKPAFDSEKMAVYQTSIKHAVTEFKDEITCFDQKVQEKAYPHFVESIKQAYGEIYLKVKDASVDTVLDTIADTSGQALKDFYKKLNLPAKPQQKVTTATEKADTRDYAEFLTELG